MGTHALTSVAEWIWLTVNALACITVLGRAVFRQRIQRARGHYSSQRSRVMLLMWSGVLLATAAYGLPEVEAFFSSPGLLQSVGALFVVGLAAVSAVMAWRLG